MTIWLEDMNIKQRNITVDLFLPESMREELKHPLGLLLKEKPTETLLNLIIKERPPLVILVGDYCVKDFLAHGAIPNISIIDGKNLRNPFEDIIIPNGKVVNAKNPPATITIEAWKIIQKAIKYLLENHSENKVKNEGRKEQSIFINSVKSQIKKQPIIIMIDGEEDLLVIPTVIESPEKSFVVYGQPNEGIVLIKVTKNAKSKFKKLIQRMKEKD